MRTTQLDSAAPGVIPLQVPVEAGTSDAAPQDLKRKAARGALASTAAQAGTFAVRIASLMVLARLLLKEDFGLVNMVTAVIGFLGLVRDAGLSAAAVQRGSITRAQTSTLFWINLAVGGVLALLAAMTAPILVVFYGDPRLFWVTVAVAMSLVFNGAAAQHRALLQRDMRFAALAVIDIVSLAFGTTVGIGMALAGYGYWALVAVTVIPPVVGVAGAWLATGWIPGMPRWRSGIRSMLLYGGALSLHNVVVYVAFNLDKVLIGRFWGPEALGVYGRAYQLVNLPNENLYGTIGLVALPALSRVQHDPVRLRSYFLKGYGLFLSLVVPLTVACALFADDIILFFLGPNWRDTADTFRMLTPAILAFAFANPFSWLMLASGRAGRCLQISLAVTPILILSYVLGLPHGPKGVAVGFSLTMVLSVVPVVAWATRGTLITMRGVLAAVTPVSVSIVIGAAAAIATRPMVDGLEPAFLRLVVESTLLFGVYLFALLFVMKQKPVYMALLTDAGLGPSRNASWTLRGPSPWRPQ
jgi:PST family polysaccharide transporter